MSPLPVSAAGGLPGVTPLELGELAPAGKADSAPAGASGFAALLADKLGSVAELQRGADAHAQAVASGQSDDLAGATVAVEKAAIGIELVGAIRNKAVEAYQDIMRMQV
jgi:flagellar hook-basal body complex protein FliE